jgi:hypothetical protein
VFQICCFTAQVQSQRPQLKISHSVLIRKPILCASCNISVCFIFSPISRVTGVISLNQLPVLLEQDVAYLIVGVADSCHGLVVTGLFNDTF